MIGHNAACKIVAGRPSYFIVSAAHDTKMKCCPTVPPSIWPCWGETFVQVSDLESLGKAQLSDNGQRQPVGIVAPDPKPRVHLLALPTCARPREG